MKVLVYKRTHTGDPSENGVFGESDCMGAIRNWHYDAVIGDLYILGKEMKESQVR